MPLLKGEIVKKTSHHRELSSYVLLFYWDFFTSLMEFLCNYCAQPILHNKSKNLSFTICISMLTLLPTSAYTVAKVHLSYFMQHCLMQTENTINRASNIQLHSILARETSIHKSIKILWVIVTAYQLNVLNYIKGQETTFVAVNCSTFQVHQVFKD